MLVEDKHCPACRHRIRAINNPVLMPRPPLPGDFVKCMTCGQILKFDGDMVLILSSEAELPPLRGLETAKINRLYKKTKAGTN